MRYLFAIFFLYLSTYSFSQPINKILIIDTLISSKDAFTIWINTPIDSTLLQNYDALDSLDSRFRTYGGYITKPTSIDINFKDVRPVILPISSDVSTAVIELPLDDSGGSLVIKGAFLISADTISISKLIVFHNCFSDTIKSQISWYINYNRDTGKDLKLLRSKHFPNKSIIKNCDYIYPTKIFVLINQKPYVISPHIRELQSAVTWYHGHKKMNRWRERVYEKRRLNGKPYRYFADCIETVKYRLFAELKL